MEEESKNKLKNIFYQLLSIDGRKDFDKLILLTEKIIKILKETKYETWKRLDITIQRRELFGKVSTYINILRYIAIFFEDELKEEL